MGLEARSQKISVETFQGVSEYCKKYHFDGNMGSYTYLAVPFFQRLKNSPADSPAWTLYFSASFQTRPAVQQGSCNKCILEFIGLQTKAERNTVLQVDDVSSEE